MNNHNPIRKRMHGWWLTCIALIILGIAYLFGIYYHLPRGHSYLPLFLGVLSATVLAGVLLIIAIRRGDMMIRVLAGIYLLFAIPVFVEFFRIKPWTPRIIHHELPAVKMTTLTSPANFSFSGDRHLLKIADENSSFDISWSYLLQAGREDPLFPFKLTESETYEFTVEETPEYSITENGDEILGRDDRPSGPIFHWMPLLVKVSKNGVILYDAEVCEIHHIRMERKQIPIRYGLFRPSAVAPTDEDEINLFPHYREFTFGGCCVFENRLTSLEFVCPACKAAHKHWEDSYLQPD